MNFEWGFKLAARQDRVIDTLFVTPYHGDPADERRLRENKLINFAAVVCPCNLVVRHWCLLDLLDGKARHVDKIIVLFFKLTYGGLWLEGYSYWCYTRRILELYAHRFCSAELQELIQRANVRFIALSYRRQDGKAYPPPFGDVWDGPMLEQEGGGCDTIHVKLPAVGFNLHTAFVDKVYIICTCGAPIDIKTGKEFIFYRGYKNKYPTKWSEICAIVSRFFELLRRGLFWQAC